MTREIKFRAKIVMDIESLAMKKGHWVEGHYYEDLQDGEWCSWIQECNDIIHYKVDKDTVGQFTGITDKNGKDIYEGDIIQSFFTKRCYVVFWSDTELSFMYKNPKSSNVFALSKPDLTMYSIVGNIHDNPELLKGGAE